MKVSVGRQNHSPERDSIVVVNGGATITITGGSLDYRQCNGNGSVSVIEVVKRKGEMVVGTRQEGSGREGSMGIKASEIQRLSNKKSHGFGALMVAGCNVIV